MSIASVDGVDRRDLGRGLGERDMGRAPDPVEAVVAEGHAVRRDRHGKQDAPGPPRVATHLEDVGRVRAELQLDRDPLHVRGMTHDAHAFLERSARDQPVARDADRAPDEVVERMDLGVGVAVRARVRQLDPAAVVVAHRALEQDGSLAADAQDRARQDPRIPLVDAEAARIGVDVAERVGQLVEVAVLEDLDRTEVGRPGDRDDPRLEEPDRRFVRQRHRSRSGPTGDRPGRPSPAHR